MRKPYGSLFNLECGTGVFYSRSIVPLRDGAAQVVQSAFRHNEHLLGKVDHEEVLQPLT